MAKVLKRCKICGAKYIDCYAPRPAVSFRWQDVACCIEHGQEWLKAVSDAGNRYDEPAPQAIEEKRHDIAECAAMCNENNENSDVFVTDPFVEDDLDDEFDDDSDNEDDYDEDEDD